MKKVKHDHKGTKLLKLGIFASLMLAPLLAVAFKCAYVTFNKNAYQSYNGNYSYNEYVELSNEQPPVNGIYFTFNNNLPLQNNFSGSTNYFYVSDIEYISGNLTTAHKDIILNTTRFQLWYDNYCYFTCPNLGTNINGATYNFTVKLNLTSVYTTTPSNNVLDNLFYQTYQYNSLDNAFYYAIDEMKNNQLFNWTTNTALYTPTSAMTNGMGITTTALPILITYWLYLTAIYIVVDIVIELFTYLTHMITSRLDT